MTVHRSLKRQRTLKRAISYAGIGLHTGETVSLTFCPAAEGTGIVFKRIDLPTQPVIPATVEYVRDTSDRSTTLGLGDVRVYTVEHVLAALRAYDVDNLCIELSSVEPPVGNGSSDVFVSLIEEAGIQELDATSPVIDISSPIHYSDKDIHIVALPHETFKVSYTLNYPAVQALQSQFHSLSITPESFKRELSPCRTFSLYEEVSYLIDRGLIKGGSLDNAVVIKGDTVFSKNGLFFPNEMARHKILDMIGDLSLVGFHFNAHIIAIRAGHAANFAFAQKILHYITTLEAAESC